MSEPVPEPSSPGFIGHILSQVRAWFEKDIAPEIGAVRSDAAKVLSFAEAHAANAEALAALFVKLVQAADPSAAPAVAALIAEAEKIAAEATRIAQELGV